MEAGTTGGRGGGWIAFAAIYIAIAGVLNVIWGFVALVDDDDYFRESSLLTSSLTFWGWVAIIVGISQVLVALLIYGRSFTGMLTGVAIALAGILLNFLSIGAYPIWSVIGLVINGIVIWALTTHQEEFD